ncbi:ankyrin repeat domain-containing protein [Sphingosinicella sp.]|uniref:ankyrin repeat domain-containing protein n=1 Tax=Sphingosinicella sp. TaxID=1917971 RepID=UPI0040381CE3
MPIRLRAFIAILFVIAGGPLIAQSGGVGFSPGFRFLKAVRERDGNVATEMTATPGATVINSRDPSNGDGALHILVRGRDLNWLSFMLSRGARADLQSNDGATALLLAAQIGWREGAERLLAARANPNLPNRGGETPLIYAVRRFDAPMVRLLMANGADPNQTDSLSGNSALDYARQDRRSQGLIPVLEARPQPPARPVQGPTPPRQP